MTFLIVFLLFGLYLLHTVHSGGVSRGKVCGCGCWPRWHVLGETWRITSDYFCFAKTQPSGPSLSISWFVRLCVCVCLSVCLSIFCLFRLNVLLPPLPKIQCQKCLEIRNHWGKVMEDGVSDLKTFVHKGCKIAATKKVFSKQFFWYIFSQKTYFPME